MGIRLCRETLVHSLLYSRTESGLALNQQSASNLSSIRGIVRRVDNQPKRQIFRTRRQAVGVVVSIVLLAVVVACLVLPIPWFTISPGMSRATEPLIAVEGAPTYENDGAVDFLTVSMRKATPLEALAAWVNPSFELRSEKEALGNQTQSENRQLNLQLMTESKDAAQYQALTRLGYEVPMSGSGAVVASVVPDSPASRELVLGDVILRANGQPIQTSRQFVQFVAQQKPGAIITLDLEPFSADVEQAKPARQVTVMLGPRPENPEVAFLGVSTFTRNLTFTFPVTVQINSGAVGGPSAGLAFTLGILDKLTPGSLTGGIKVATTGTMSLDGSVGPIGGMPQKVEAARRNNVKLMLVPISELEDAQKHAGDLEVVGVATLDEALEVLTRYGGGNAVLPPKPNK